jgi:ABC-2 type transport system permease protein
MSSLSSLAVATLPQRRNLPRIFAKEAKYEFLKSLRLPIYSVSTIAFPVMFYLFFGVIFGKQHVEGVNLSTYLLASYGTFGVMGSALFGFGVGLAVERGLGWLQVKKASPMPPAAYLFAKLLTSGIFGLTVIVLMILAGLTLGGAQITAGQALRLVATLLLGSLPFSALGLAIGSVAKPNSAPAVVNMIYLPLSVLSGLWIPFQGLPPLLQHIGRVLPPYHLNRLALAALDIGRPESPWPHINILLGYTCLFLGLAALAFRRDEGKMYG